MNYKKEIAALIGHGAAEDDISKPTESAMGDYCFACFKLAKELKKAPAAIAAEIADNISKPPFATEVQAVGGYVNFFLNRDFFIKETLSKLAVTKPGQRGQNGKTICIDFSSINIAKPFHMGHLPSTAIGGSLYRIFKALGYNVIGINHLGDYGTQFGKLISVYKRIGNLDEIKCGGVKEMQRLYVKYADFEKDEPDIINEARAWSLKIEKGDEEAVGLFNTFKEITLKEVDRVYGMLGISFDSYLGESFFAGKVAPVVKELDEKNLLSESDGAKIVDLEKYNMPPCLILRGDGASLYATRDIAAAKYRKEYYNFDKCLYVVAYQQNLHFKQVFKVIDLMGYDWAKDLEHVAFGMVSLDTGTLSSRSGNVVYLADVLDKAVARMRQIMLEKRVHDGLDTDKVASSVGIGAVIFSALNSAKIKDVTFSLDKVLEFEGETGPYLQYTHSRCCSVLAKAAEQGIPNVFINEKATKAVNELFDNQTAAIAINNDEAYELIKDLAAFDDAVADAGAKYEPCILTKHLLSIAAKFNKFYFEHKILENNSPHSAARVALTAAVQKVLSAGLNLILMDAVEKM